MVKARPFLNCRQKQKKLKFKEVIIGYDKFKDKGAVTTKPYNLISGGEAFAAGMADSLSRGPRGTAPGTSTARVLLLVVAYPFKGDRLTETAEGFQLLFGSGGSRDWQFLKGDKNLYVLLDGERMEFYPSETDRDSSYNGVTEMLGFSLSRDQLKRFSKAKSIEIKLGDTIPRKLRPEVLSRIGQILAITEIR